MVLVIICWFNVDYCFLSQVSVYYDGRVYSIILMLCEAIGSVYYIIFVSRRLNISCIKFKIRSFCSMFGIRDEISSGIWENDETREIRWEDLRWKRLETKADEPRGQEVSAGRK